MKAAASNEFTRTGPLPPGLVARIFLPFALGYFLSQHFRAVNAIIAPNLVEDTGVDPMQLGVITSAYFLAFAAAQLPLGVLLDRFGPRRVEVAFLVIAAVGAVLFGFGSSVAQMVLGRALIGFGVGCCCMAAFKAFVMWLPKDKLPFANGCLMAAGGLGVLMSTVPVEAALSYFDWRELYYLLAAVTLLVATLIYLLIPEHSSAAQREDFRAQLSGLGQVFKSSYFWRVVPFAVVLEGGVIGFITLWAGPWLRDVCGFSRDEVAFGLLAISIAMILGFPFHGYLASRLNRKGISTMTVSITGMCVSLIFAVVAFFQLAQPALLFWVLFIFFATSSIQVFAALSQYFPETIAGRSNTALNFLLFLAAFAAQAGIGAILNQYEMPSEATGYSLAGYRKVAELFLGAQLIGLAWYLGFGWYLKRREARRVYAT